MTKTSVVIPNWNGADSLPDCLDSLLAQSRPVHIILVDNGSADGSRKLLTDDYPQVEVLYQSKNLGFAGGINVGIRRAVELECNYVALFNNDAVADKDWLRNLTDFLNSNPNAGIATGKLIDSKGKVLDSTGESYTIWGLPYPRGRGENFSSAYDNDRFIFAASGGASIYRIKMLKEIGLFDEDFFAYYEDVDISFRAQLAGWKVGYEPRALAYHQIGATSGKIKGFTTYQTLKNLPLLLWKNVPWALMPRVWPRFVLAYLGIAFQALRRGQYGPVVRGVGMSIVLWPKKLARRHQIQKKRKVSAEYINSIIVHDLPPNAARLRALRQRWWRLRGKARP